MRSTAVVMNLCIFGAVAVGPVIGGIQAGATHWRPLFWVVAGLAALTVVFAVLT
jgi:MFS family permease